MLFGFNASISFWHYGAISESVRLLVLENGQIEVSDTKNKLRKTAGFTNISLDN